MLDFEEWFEINEDELLIKAAELGLDREMDFSFDDWAEEQYENYCEE